MDSLKSCPFCDSDRIVPRDRNQDCDYFVVYCHACQAEGPNGKTLSEAIAAWNRRPSDDAIIEQCAGVADKIAKKNIEPRAVFKLLARTVAQETAQKIASAIRALKEKA